MPEKPEKPANQLLGPISRQELVAVLIALEYAVRSTGRDFDLADQLALIVKACQEGKFKK